MEGVSYPILVFDDDCGFCTWWANYFNDRTEYTIIGFSDIDPELEQRLPSDYSSCSHFVTETEVYSCGASIEEAFRRSRIGRVFSPLIQGLRWFRAYHWVRERVYRWIADNRSLWGRILSSTPPASK